MNKKIKNGLFSLGLVGLFFFVCKAGYQSLSHDLNQLPESWDMDGDPDKIENQTRTGDAYVFKPLDLENTFEN